ncbi:hypothetical protein HRG_003653 [Hirsutella rhossiliensis]|uniref:Uncharacterized protein n=1 Tax=Hirsutella rhossiliensis TaxID=111463 RepID=A0A9P8N6P0_9HYPO|nr:uncharacterized protein HRG_03653 [Hirsutella rhossiliensis]KAH0965637.1 hypothetical protein HRG_03653 [Hirsutella rhossiliensis]
MSRSASLTSLPILPDVVESAARQTCVSRAHHVDPEFNRPRGLSRAPKPLKDTLENKSAQNDDRCLIHTVEFDLVHGDTIVFVDMPNMPKDPRKQADCDNIAYRSHSFRVHSDKLLATGSAKFAQMLSPLSQSRIQLRRKVVNRLPRGVHYVLDLTPPSEGDELVFQMTELSLTPGIMAWWSSHKFHGVDRSLVSGHDDVCTCRRQAQTDGDEESRLTNKSSLQETSLGLSKSQSIPPTPNQLMQMKVDGDAGIYEPPPFRRIPDYCPIRHRNAIVRLVMLIQGRDVLLDSANRVWTLVALANILDCTSVVRDRVMKWIMHGSNTRFIEVLPEEALRIGFAIRNAHVTQCAFRILVNELAIHEAADDAAERNLTQTTVFGRRRGECGDELNNLIQHAARALVERVSSTKAQLQSPDLLQFWKIQEWSKLRRLEHLLAKGQGSAFHSALDKLRRFMRWLPMAVASKLGEAAQHAEDNHQTLWSTDVDRATYVLPKDFERLECIMTRLNLIQKLLCPFVWRDLGERCSWPLYLGPRLAGEPAGRPRFGNMLQELEDSLRQVIIAEPAAARTYEWMEFLDSGQVLAGIDGPTVKSPLIDLDRVDWQVKDALLPLTLSWVRHDIYPPLNLTRHLLLTLTMEEMKFLPLWAGGFDDGTGGVFESFVPPTDMGPSGPGPAYHTGRTVRSDAPSLCGTLIDEFSAVKLKDDTTDASVNFHDGASTTNEPGGATAARDMSGASESFTTHRADYEEARAAVPAEHQVSCSHEVMWMDESDSGWNDERQSAVMDFGSVVMDGFEFEGDDLERSLSDLSDSEGSMVVV